MQDIKENQAVAPGVTPRTMPSNPMGELQESFEKMAVEAAPLPVYQKQDSQNRQMPGMNKIQASESTSNREFTARDQTNKMNQQPQEQRLSGVGLNLIEVSKGAAAENSQMAPIGKQNSSTQQLPFKNLASTTELRDEASTSDDAEQRLPTAGTTMLDQDESSNSHNANSEELAELSSNSTEKAPASVSEVFRLRLQNLKKDISKSLSFADQLDMRDVQCVTEMANNIFDNMRKMELEHQLPLDFLSKVQIPSEVKDTSRAFLVEWIIDVHRKFRLVPETLYVAVQLIDRYLSIKQIKKNQLHILGVTALLIATKYEEIYPPELKDLLSVSENKFTRSEVLEMERDILNQLQFQCTSPTAYRFLERFRKLSPAVANDDQVFFMAQYIQEIALLDASLLKCRPSEIAAVSLMLAFKGLKKTGSPWSKEVETTTGMLESDLLPVMEDVRGFVVEVNPRFLTTLKYKFSKESYKSVATLPFGF